MSFWHFWKYYNIVKIDETPVELKVNQTCFHQSLEHNLGIHQSKRHMITFAKSQWAYSECCQWLKCLIHLNLPIAWLEVQCCKPYSPVQTIQSVFNPGETIGIFDSVGIQFSQINVKSELTIPSCIPIQTGLAQGLCNDHMAHISSISFRCSPTSSYILGGICQ